MNKKKNFVCLIVVEGRMVHEMQLKYTYWINGRDQKDMRFFTEWNSPESVKELIFKGKKRHY